MEEAMLENEL